MLELDVKNKLQLEMSNDAFHYIYFDEEPICDITQEIEDFKEAFPLSIYIEDYELIPNTGRVRVEAVPYIESTFKAEYMFKFFNGWHIEWKPAEGGTVYYRWVHDTKGPGEVEETYTELLGSDMVPYFVTKLGSKIAVRGIRSIKL